MKKNLFRKKNSHSENILCISFLCQRERERHWVVQKAQPCVLRFCVVNHFILRGRRSWVSKHRNDCVRGEICFKEIVSNTRLDLNHSFFTHLVCEFLIICRFLYIYIYIYIQYLFIVLVYHIYLCYCLYLDLCVVSFCLIIKVNYWIISNNFKVDFIYFNLH